MHILLISRSYPPLNYISSLRAYHWAKYLAKEGVTVSVLTTTKHSKLVPTDLVKPSVENVNLYEVDFIHAWLLKLVENVLPTPQSSKKTKNKKARPSFLKNKIRKILRFFLGKIDIYMFWTGAATQRAKDIHEKEKIDVVISTYGPKASHVIARNLKKRGIGKLWIADYRDLWTYNPNQTSKWPVRSLSLWSERRIVGKHADIVTSISDGLSNRLKSFLNIPVLTIPNGFDPDEYPGWEERIEAANTKLPKNKSIQIVHTGTIYEGERDPSALFKAINKITKKSQPNFQCDFYGRNLSNLDKIIMQNNASSYARNCGYIAREKALALQQAADVLLLLSSSGKKFEGVMTGKVFEYLVSGKPVLGIGFDKTTELGKMIEQCGVGWALGNDIENISNILTRFIQGNIPANFMPDKQKILAYSREKQAQKLLNIIKDHISIQKTPTQQK